MSEQSHGIQYTLVLTAGSFAASQMNTDSNTLLNKSYILILSGKMLHQCKRVILSANALLTPLRLASVASAFPSICAKPLTQGI
jgi:uncharacterized membrane protein YcaP (DUF421 family)